MGAVGPSQHLTWAELACRDGTPYPYGLIRNGTAEKLALMFELIRALYNKPIRVVSAYRTNAYNTKIGGARNSQHKLGKALDLKPPKGVSIKQFYMDIRFWADYFNIKGLGRYPTFIHVDIRDTDKLVCWKAGGLKDDY